MVTLELSELVGRYLQCFYYCIITILLSSWQALTTTRRVKEMCPLVLGEDNRTFFIVGGGKDSLIRLLVTL